MDVDCLGDDRHGRVFVFTRTGDTWTPQAELVNSDASTVTKSEFGSSVDIHGDTVVAAASMVSENFAYGGTYVFTRSGGVWTEQAKLDFNAPRWSVESLAISGKSIVAGSFGAPIIVFRREGDNWTEDARLLAGGSSGRVAIDGDTMVTGLYGHDNDPNWALVFRRSGSTWEQTGELRAPDGSVSDKYGSTVALSGNTAVVGSPDRFYEESGCVYVFRLM